MKKVNNAFYDSARFMIISYHSLLPHPSPSMKSTAFSALLKNVVLSYLCFLLFCFEVCEKLEL